MIERNSFDKALATAHVSQALDELPKGGMTAAVDSGTADAHGWGGLMM